MRIWYLVFAIALRAQQSIPSTTLESAERKLPAERLFVRAYQAGAAPERIEAAAALAALEKEAATRAAADQFSGAILVARDGKVLFEKAYGLADREKKTPNTFDTQFRIGSMNKMFTAVATLQLVGAGKLSLDDPIAKHWPDYPNAEVANKVTIRHLLTHTGGTGDIFGPEFAARRLELKSLEDYAKLYGARGLRFEPGTRREYSNYGFLLLGLIIQRVSGSSYYDYVREHIFKPAGMLSTDSQPESERVERRATGYMKRNGQWIPNTDTLPWRGTSAGGGYSTVRDLLRFAEALRGGKLIRRDLLEQATSKQFANLAPRPNAGYGLGFGVFPNYYGHNGGAPGMNGDLRIYPASGTVVIALANLDPPAAGSLVRYYCDRMPSN